MNPRERARLRVLKAMFDGQVQADEAAVVLRLSERQVWRLLAAYRKQGLAALRHGNRGRQPGNATPEPVRRLVIRLATDRYGGVNHSHLTDLLAEREGILLSRSTVRRLLVAAGMPSPKRRRPPRHRVRRERMPQEGLLVQIDGSDHDWLEGRGPRMSLLLAVDDATSTVAHALFRDHEDTEGYFELLRGLIQQRGIPVALYSDRHGTFQNPRGQQPGPTQFGRAMQELGIQQVFAHSPQAKGRVERTAGTFQDRLVSELRLAGANSLITANEVVRAFLPRFNERFGVAPREATSAYRAVPPGLRLDDVLCYRHTRRVARDNTVQFAWRTVQLLPTPDRPTYAGVSVEVREHLDGKLTIWHAGSLVPSQEGPSRLTALRAVFRRSSSPHTTRSESLPDRWGSLRLTGNGSGPGGEEEPAGSDAAASERGRQPTPRQRARWIAIDQAIREGLGLRAVARQVGISRNTVKKYLAASGPPVNKPVPPRPNQRSRDWLLTLSLSSSP